MKNGGRLLGSLPLGVLEADDVLRLQAFRAPLDFELNRLAFIEGLVPLRLNGGEMYEDILTGLALDEPVALAGVEPLHCSLFSHFCSFS